MRKTMTMMKKLAWLAMMALPRVVVADVVSPSWDETVREPVTVRVPGILFDAWDWRYWSVFAVVFVIVIGLTIWWGRRRSKKCRFPNCTFPRVGVYVPSTWDYVIMEVLVGVAIAACIYLFGGMRFGYNNRVIHHPAERPDHLRISHPD